MVTIITFEGSDYVGKTTASKYLVGHLARENILLNDGVIYPTSLSSQVCDSAKTANDLTKEMLYTIAFILDKQFAERHNDQRVIVQDRYWPSTVAYGRFLNSERSINSLFDFREMFIQPFAVIYLTCSVEEKIRRSTLRKRKSFLDELFIKNYDLSNKLEEEIINSIKDLPIVISIDTTSRSIEETVSIIERALIEREVIK